MSSDNISHYKASPATGSEDVRLGVLSNSLGYALRRAQLVVFDDFIRKLEPVGLRPAFFAALVIIHENPGLKQSVVSAVLRIQRTNFVMMVDELEKRGLVERRPSKKDRRSHELHLTEAGQTLLEEAYQLYAEHEARFEKKMAPGSREQLLPLLQRLAA